MVPNVPQIDYIQGVTIYSDTDKDHRFYVIPDQPKLRYGPDGKPIFQFLKYREDPSTLGDGSSRGGGFVQFDCDLGIPDAKMNAIRAQLQDRVNQLYQRQGRGNPPAVELAMLPWADDDKTKVELHTFTAKPDGSGMVTQIIGGAKPSLLGSNVASFALELTQRGAALMWQACQMADLPVSVYYDIKFFAQIPALRMHLWLYASQLHTYWEQINKDIDSGTCGDTDEDYTRFMQENFSKYQIAGVDITDFPSDLGTDGTDVEKFKNQMIQDGWGLIEDALKDSMKDKFDPVKDADKGDVGDYRNVVRSYLQSYSEDLNLLYTRDSVVRWPVHPQGTMQGFLNTPGPDGKLPKKEDFFKEISLDDPFFRMLQIAVRCNADFQNDPIFSVKVHIDYADRAQDLIFTDNTSVQKFQEFIKPELGRNYKYWTEVTYKDSDRKLRGPDTNTNETQLVLSVKDFGFLKLQIFAGAINWDVIDSAQVHIKYQDDANGVGPEEDVVLLSKDVKTATYQRLIWAPVTNAYQYQTEFFLKDGQKVQLDWASSISLQLVINDMFEEHLAVKVFAPMGFDRISKIIVDLDYQDAAHSYSAQKTFELTADQDYFPWLVPIYKGATQSFRYRTVTAYKDGHADQTDWQTQAGSMTLVVGPVPADWLVVSMVPDLVDFNVVKLVKVALHYADTANAIDATDDFVFTKDKKTSQIWRLPILDKTKKQYSYNATYFLADGSQRLVPDTATSDDTIILQVPAPLAQPATPGR